jgi:hypothetical protein
MQWRRGEIETIAAPAIAYHASGDVRRAIGRIGRTEDVAFSPAGDRIAIAGFLNHRLLVLDIDADMAATQPRVALTGCLEILCDAFHLPHGLAWADESTLIVANRDRQMAIVPLPGGQPGTRRVKLEDVRLLGGGGKDLVATPVALCVVPAGMGLIELLVCNDFVHHVSRHLIDRRAGDAVLASELLLVAGIEKPHGIVQSPSGRWLAVANHAEHAVLLFRNDDRLGAASRAAGILSGMTHPHAIRFGADERSLLVAEGGGPFVHLFRSEDCDWSGERAAVGRIRTISETLFRRGNHSSSEGGPKGIDLGPDNRLLAVSCAEQPLALFDLRGVLAPAAERPVPTAADETERARATMARYLRRARDAAQHESEAIRRASRYEREELIRRQDMIAELKVSWSWRITHPLRLLNKRAQQARRAIYRVFRP